MEPAGVLHINLLGGKDIKNDGTSNPFLYVKIKVGSDTSWTDQPARSYTSPTFNKKFTGFNVRQSVVVEFQVINKTKNSDTVVGRGRYAVGSLSPIKEIIYVPLDPVGFLEVEMAYERNSLCDVDKITQQKKQQQQIYTQPRNVPIVASGPNALGSVNNQMAIGGQQMFTTNTTPYPRYPMNCMNPMQQQRPMTMSVPINVPMSVPVPSVPIYIQPLLPQQHPQPQLQPQQQQQITYPTFYPMGGYQQPIPMTQGSTQIPPMQGMPMMQKMIPQPSQMQQYHQNPYPMYQPSMPTIQYPTFSP